MTEQIPKDKRRTGCRPAVWGRRLARFDATGGASSECMTNARHPLLPRSKTRLARFVFVAAVGALTPKLVRAQVQQAGEPRVTRLLSEGDEAWQAGKFDEALARYEAVLRSDSTSARAVFRVATLLAWRNDLGRSESMFRLYLRLAPGDDDGRIGLARILAWAGRYEQSVALSDSVLAVDPKQRDAALLAAQARAWNGKLRLAINRYRNWLSGHPNDAEAWMASEGGLETAPAARSQSHSTAGSSMHGGGITGDRFLILALPPLPRPYHGEHLRTWFKGMHIGMVPFLPFPRDRKDTSLPANRPYPHDLRTWTFRKP